MRYLRNLRLSQAERASSHKKNTLSSLSFHCLYSFVKPRVARQGKCLLPRTRGGGRRGRRGGRTLRCFGEDVGDDRIFGQSVAVDRVCLVVSRREVSLDDDTVRLDPFQRDDDLQIAAIVRFAEH